MPRIPRVDRGGHTYHVINRAVGRLQIFNHPGDYLDFIDIMKKAKEVVPVKIYAYCIMPNHWHLLVETIKDGDLGLFMHALANTHTRRVHQITETIGSGPLYQGRYKSFLVDSDEYFITVLQYIERNGVRAGLSAVATDWRWGSAWLKAYGTSAQKSFLDPIDWYSFPDYLAWINAPDAEDTLGYIRTSIKKSLPFGRPTWVEQMVKVHGLEAATRTAGRPQETITHGAPKNRDCPD